MGRGHFIRIPLAFLVAVVFAGALALCFPLQVQAAAPSFFRSTYGVDALYPTQMLPRGKTIILNEGQKLRLSFNVARNTQEDVSVSVYMATAIPHSPFGTDALVDTRVLDTGAPAAFSTAPLTFLYGGNYPITVTVQNDTTGETDSFQFTVQVMGTTLPPAVEVPGQSEPALPETPAQPAPNPASPPADPAQPGTAPVRPETTPAQQVPALPAAPAAAPAETMPETPAAYNPAQDAFWQGLAAQIAQAPGGTVQADASWQGSNYVPAFVLDVLREGQGTLEIVHDGETYFLSPARLAQMADGASYMFITLKGLGYTLPEGNSLQQEVPPDTPLANPPQQASLPETAAMARKEGPAARRVLTEGYASNTYIYVPVLLLFLFAAYVSFKMESRRRNTVKAAAPAAYYYRLLRGLATSLLLAG